MSTLISTEQLDRDRADPALVLLDASFYLPTEPQNARALFADAHIPGAAFFDIDAISDHSTSLPHMLPDEAAFAEAAEGFGISNGSRVVVYDQRGLFSAARVWWMFRVFGHDAVLVLNGGLPKWRREGRAVSTGEAKARPRGQFTPRFRPELVRDRAAVTANIATKAETLLDARAAGRFSGAVPEPRPGMRSGHVPGARSLPFTELLGADGTLKSPDALRTEFAARGIGADSRPVTMCGSGVTGAVLSLGLVSAGLPTGALYDGSWAEWGGLAETPVEVTA
ncbi:MAG TPA: 3-mercaptopyruvate sulfurtransferase [Acidiphilium sp.]